ncbi:putative RNA-directed DNA polymerase [Helianthus annuus]|nr:putative RNA-directed DNA polymerase [Helianthus annuus]
MTKNSAETSSKPSSLHPAYSVTNIQTKIRTLDGTKVTYSSWVKLFRLHAVAYKVSEHITDTPAPATTSADYEAWKELDALVLQWIYSTMSDDLLTRILDTKATAYSTWSKLEKIFLSNKKARAAALETKFCNLTLGACASDEEYCQRLTDLANQLADVDQPVTESRLVLQLVRGLPEEYNTTAALINQNGVDWDQAITMLNGEVLRIEARQGSPSTVLAAPAAPAPPAPANNNNNNPQPPHAQYAAFPQAHYASQSPHGGYNALCPSDLSAAFANMQVNQPNSSWTSDVMDTRAESHVTHNPGSSSYPMHVAFSP